MVFSIACVDRGLTKAATGERMKTRKKVLVIDDDKDFGLALTYFFATKPYTLLLAYTLAEGMTAIEKERPDHVFLDNGLPDGEGWAKAEYIMAHYPQIQINLISAMRIPKPITVARILDKPISLNDFLLCLD